ncbi:hypothetical protein PFICI_00391 [Pestalotiopsis fici W106-1]|uniref:Uncharacterized protein n=1 Tax=Pestalotiopsis fici (strain W106-1 / CGMCC3.15140) TaxID=1229662 RepID=W3XKH9_PESFW|nr:uncharacterized protein PFICI_00391 [Pestalotiopsis fici W106-1]ETS86563.1 hypothetical protein PFICI_00391 [Pestalotiopsis fici W106-1]
MVVVHRKHWPPAFKVAVKHPETGRPYHPGSWELNHSEADRLLVEKAGRSNHELTDEERDQIRAMPAMSSPIIVKTLADPSSLTEEERCLAMDWPPEQQRRANIAGVGLGDMDPDQILAQTAADPGWLRTRAQAELIVNRFNVRPRLPRLDFWEFPYDQRTADRLVQKKDDFFVYMKARRQQDLLTRPDPIWTGAKEKVTDLENQVEDKRAYERSREHGMHCLITTPEWIRQLKREDATFGFNIYKTAEVPVLYDEFLAAERKRPSSRILTMATVDTFQELWKYFMNQRVFGQSGEIRYINLLLRGTNQADLERENMVWTTGDLEAPAADAAAFKNHHRLARAGWENGIHPRYFLVMDKEGFPPIKHVIFRHRAIFPEVWIYDAEWAPPPGVDGIHDEDGYQGRIRMRYPYHTYMYFYPLTLEPGFDLKTLWMEQEDKSKPYPFPWTDIGYHDYGYSSEEDEASLGRLWFEGKW